MATLKANSISRDLTAARAVQRLDPTTKTRDTPITSFGAVAQSQGQGGASGMPTSISFTLDNSGGAVTKDYKVGDASNWVLAAAGLAGVQPDSSSGIAGAAFAAAVAQAPMTVLGINYRSTSGAVQFVQKFRFIKADVDGSALVKPVNLPEYQRNTAQDPNLLTLEFQNQFVLDWNTAFYISAGVGQVVTVTLMFGAAGYR